MARKRQRWKLWRAFWRHPVLGSVITGTAIVAAALLAPSGAPPPSPESRVVAPDSDRSYGETAPPVRTPRLPHRIDLDPSDDRECVPEAECCRICRKGKACGDSCIQVLLTCRKGDGCACNEWEVCEGG